MLAFLGNVLRNVVSVFLLPTNYTNPNREDAMGVYNICFGKEMTGSELFVGIDVHKTSWHITAVDQEQETITSFSQPAGIDVLIARLEKAREVGIHVNCVYESGYFGYKLQRTLESAGFPCIVTPPNMIPVQVGKKVKTDRLDSRKLAVFHCKGLLEKVWVPSKEMHDHRALQRARDEVQKAKKALMVQIKAKYSEYGIAFPESHHWTKKLIASLAAMPLGSDSLEMVRDRQIMRLRGLMEDVAFYDAKIKKLSGHHFYQETVSRLLTIPGVGMITAMRLMLEIGGYHRFHSGDRLASYSGLTPSQYSSGDTVRMGHISRCGRPQIREILIEAAWVLTGRDAGMKQFFERIALRRDRKRAIVAVARKLLTIMWSMATKGTNFLPRQVHPIST